MKAKHHLLLLAIFFLMIIGCATPLAMKPTNVFGDAQPKETVMIVQDVSFSLSNGHKGSVRANTAWSLIGSCDYGQIFKPQGHTFTIEDANMYEAYIVLNNGNLTAFYIPVFKTVAPLTEPRKVAFKPGTESKPALASPGKTPAVASTQTGPGATSSGTKPPALLAGTQITSSPQPLTAPPASTTVVTAPPVRPATSTPAEIKPPPSADETKPSIPVPLPVETKTSLTTTEAHPSPPVAPAAPSVPLMKAPAVPELKRTALVIGNNDYQQIPALKNAVNDAMDMAAALKRAGFEVLLRKNTNRNQLREAVREFGDAIKKGGVGLVFYAGHGVQVDGENYLVPIDADVQRKFEVQDQCVKASYILAAMEEANNKLNIVMMDACRDNPFRSFRSTARGLAQMDAPVGSLLAYATAPGSVASDGDGRNGLYTEVVLKHMLTPGQNILDMFMKVRQEVAANSGGKQIPWENHSLMGHFYFLP